MVEVAERCNCHRASQEQMLGGSKGLLFTTQQEGNVNSITWLLKKAGPMSPTQVILLTF